MRYHWKIYMHDGALAYFTCNVREWLDAHFPDRWITGGGLYFMACEISRC